VIDKPQDVNIIDATGRTIFTKTNVESNLNIDVSQFSIGIYIIKIGSETARFIKK